MVNDVRGHLTVPTASLAPSKTKMVAAAHNVRVILIFLWAAVTVIGQPVVTAVRSAATNASPTSASGLAPQMLVAITGENLSTASATTATYPWPTQLGGATVTFNGTQAALAYASPSQINAVLPSAVSGSTTAAVVVTTAAGRSMPATVPIAVAALGLFTQDMSGCGQGVALNIHSDGTVTMNTPQNSLDPIHDYGLMLLATGVGPYQDRIDGVPWQFKAADNRGGQGGVNAIFGIPNLGTYSPPLAVTYAGPMPLQSGLDQVNVALTTSPDYISLGRAPEGCRVPLYLGDSTSASQVVNVSIHSGGGTCSDSPSNSLGLVTWQQNAISDLSSSSSSNTVNIQFLQSPRLNFTLPPGQSGVTGTTLPQPTFCAAAYPTTLDAGTITVSGGGSGSTTIQPQAQSGITSYDATLPDSPGGAYSITATGSTSGVGPFTAAATIPPPITITNNLNPGTQVSVPFTLNWTGGDTRSLITVTFIDTTNPGQAEAPMVQATVLGDAGRATASQFPSFGCGCFLPVMKGPGAEIIVTQQPATSPAQPFQAPGLSLGGAQSWKYVWDFRGLSNQSQ